MPLMDPIKPFVTYITLEMEGETKRFLVSAKQGDKSTRVISALLIQQNGAPYPLPAHADITANIEKPDGKSCYAATGVNEDGRVEIVLTQQALAVAGTARCDIDIRAPDSSEVLSSVVFEIEVEKNVRNDDNIISSDEMSALDIKLAAINKALAEEVARQTAEASRATSENTRQNNEAARKLTETARINAEDTRASDETSRKQAEAGRVSSESIRVSKENARDQAETNRVTAEDTRQSNENARREAEEQRQNDTADALEQVHDVLGQMEMAEGDMKSEDYDPDRAVKQAGGIKAFVQGFFESIKESLIALSSPTGDIRQFAGAVAPTGFLLCRGQAVSRTTYAKLFSVCGVLYGSGDGSTTFNLPDMRGRVPVGVSTLGLGATAGRDTITANDLPKHSLSIPALSGTASSAAPHQHNVNLPSTGALPNGSGGQAYTMSGSAAEAATIALGTATSNGGHGHTVSTTASNTGTIGTSTTMDIRQPSIGLNYIIKT